MTPLPHTSVVVVVDVDVLVVLDDDVDVVVGTTIVVVVGAAVVVVVVVVGTQLAVGHGTHVTFTLSVSLTFFAVPFAEAVSFFGFDGFLPFFWSFSTSEFVNAPHTELVPFGVTLMPTFFGLTFALLSACAGQLAVGKFTQARTFTVQEPFVAPSLSQASPSLHAKVLPSTASSAPWSWMRHSVVGSFAFANVACEPIIVRMPTITRTRAAVNAGVRLRVFLIGGPP